MDCLRDGAQCFDNWAYDILHGRLERVLSAEKQAGEKYPKCYKYTTGENAEKSRGIMNSTSGGYCVNASVPGKDGDGKIYANVPVSFHDLRHIAERFMISFEPRRNVLEEIRRKAEADSKNWVKAAEETANDDAAMTESKPAEVKEEVKKSEQPKAEKKSATTEKKPTPETTAVKVKTKTELTPDGKGGYFLSAYDVKNNTIDFVFPKEYWKSNKYGEEGESFKEKASASKGIMYVLHFYTYNGKKYVAEIEEA